ncbi:hypothetical protein GGS23DRAFT_186757 [Durotheca rogersii]|uniref:uncharacterized protein n=1 Tax=Durotheca rogersii TaxID=419775 RepID=UPI00221F8AE4|nr:uncharacterized protein GGS23DRAFT_186757 [Durotheca rogersii]KAI5867626.1 hypothetical protein GGS23DRAFT_186757 [Durotheca rogersii]
MPGTNSTHPIRLPSRRRLFPLSLSPSVFPPLFPSSLVPAQAVLLVLLVDDGRVVHARSLLPVCVLVYCDLLTVPSLKVPPLSAGLVRSSLALPFPLVPLRAARCTLLLCSALLCLFPSRPLWFISQLSLPAKSTRQLQPLPPSPPSPSLPPAPRHIPPHNRERDTCWSHPSIRPKQSRILSVARSLLLPTYPPPSVVRIVIIIIAVVSIIVVIIRIRAVLSR